MLSVSGSSVFSAGSSMLSGGLSVLAGANVKISGSSKVTVNNALTIAPNSIFEVGTVLTVSGGVTIAATAVATFNGTMSVSGMLSVSGSSVFSAGSSMLSGGLSVLAGASTKFSGTSNVTVNGAFTVASNAVIEVDASTTVTANFGSSVAGTAIIKGTYSGNYNQTGGVLKGVGHITGNCYIHSGASISAGLSPGTIFVDGDLIMDVGTITEIEAESDLSFDHIIVLGKAKLNGHLSLKLLNGYNPTGETKYSGIIAYTKGYEGSFLTLTAQGLENFLTTKIHPNYGNNALDITYINSSALLGPSITLVLFALLYVLLF